MMLALAHQIIFLERTELGYLRYRISSNKRRVSNKRRTLGYPHWNKRLQIYILPVSKPKCMWN